MSKTLILVRHAKSSWSQANTADIDRPLKKRGHRDAQLVGSWINTYCKQNTIRTVKQLVSPASRTQLTAKLISESLSENQHACQISSETVDSIYLAEPSTLIEIILQQEDSTNCVMIVGHNPSMHELAEYYSTTHIEKFPTCAAACFRFRGESWRTTSSSNCEDVQLIRPKLLYAD